MKKGKQILLVILGMHRSGTSALSRGLRVFHAKVSNNLIPAENDTNIKGHWEDSDIYAFNEQLFARLGTSWKALRHLDEARFLETDLTELRKEAKILLGEKIQGVPLFGLKDPRTSILLPFWQPIFDELGLDDRYLISLRNPLDVATSLEKRNSIPHTQSFMLWAKHTICALKFTEGRGRTLVSYDKLLKSPDLELKRIAGELELKLTPDHAHALREYADDFLSKDMRHNHSSKAALARSQEVPRFVVKAYDCLLKVIKNKIELDSKEFKKAWSSVERGYLECMPLSVYVDELNTSNIGARKEIEKLSMERNALRVELPKAQALVEQKTLECEKALVERGEMEAQRDYAAKESEQAHLVLNQYKAGQNELIEQRDSACQERDEALQSHKVLQMETEATSQEFDRQLEQVNKEKDLILKERDKARFEQIALSEKLDFALSEREIAYAEKEAAIQEFDRQLERTNKEKDLVVRDLDKALFEQSALSEKLNSALSERDIASAESEAASQEFERQFEQVNKERDLILKERDKARFDQIALSEKLDSSLREVENAYAERDTARKEADLAFEERTLAINAKDKALLRVQTAAQERDEAVAAMDKIIEEKETLEKAHANLKQQLNSHRQASESLQVSLNQQEQKLQHKMNELDRVFSSNSWHLTRPLRAFRRNLLKRPYLMVRRNLSDSARSVWRRLPLNPADKSRLKGNVFRALPTFLGWTQAYRAWLTFDGQQTAAGILVTTSGPIVSDEEAINDLPNKDNRTLLSGLIPVGAGETTEANNAAVYFKGRDASYFALRQEILDSDLWDESWYLSRYYGAFIKRKLLSGTEHFSPLDYYLQEGWRLGHEPTALLPITVDEEKIGCSKLEFFLNKLRFYGYHFDENIWIPSDDNLEKYRRQKQNRKANKVVYTCIVNNYNTLMQPYYIADEYDYVCFTDDPDLIDRINIGVWEILPLSLDGSDATTINRWHKMHPHVLFPNYEESIYIDGNINIRTNYIFEQIRKRGLSILLPHHFLRNCLYQEIEALQQNARISNEEKSNLNYYRDFLEQEGFPKEFGLCENNIIYRRHHDAHIIKLMHEWWNLYGKYSSRDQTSLSYLFWKNGLSPHKYMFSNCRINYKDFWIVKHNENGPIAGYIKEQALTPAFKQNNIAVVFSTNADYIPYLGVAIYSLIKNISKNYNYDIIVLVNGLNPSYLDKIRTLAHKADNISIRIYDTAKLVATLPRDIFHVEGYVPIDTYNKCFITEILKGYDRCVYLDSDIIVLDDIQKLHDIDLKGHAIGASVNVANVNAAYCKKIIKGKQFDEYLIKNLGVIDPNKYFQAGVVVLDMNKLYKSNLLGKTVELLNRLKKPLFFDQCVFNSLFYGDVCFFSTQWNHVWYMQQYSYLRGSVPDDVFFDYACGRVDPKIIHYASKDKPQSKTGWLLSDIFWNYAYESPFIGEIKKDILNKNNEVSSLISNELGKAWYHIKPRVLVHVHLYYRDQLDDMLNALSNICFCDYDLFVTMVDKDKVVERKILSQHRNAHILVLPNVGYDIYPFLHILMQVRISNYEFILKIHTKNARAVGQDIVYGVKVPGYQWRDELLSAIIGSKERFKRNLIMLIEDKSLGCIGAKRFVFSTQENNEEKTYALSEWRSKYGITGGIHYVGGSMFFARAYPFERLGGLNIQPEDFKSEHMCTKDYKNTAHIYERLFGLVVENEGFAIRGV